MRGIASSVQQRNPQGTSSGVDMKHREARPPRYPRLFRGSFPSAGMDTMLIAGLHRTLVGYVPTAEGMFGPCEFRKLT